MSKSKMPKWTDHTKASIDEIMRPNDKSSGKPDMFYVDPKVYDIFKNILNGNKTDFKVGDWGLMDGHSIVEVKSLMDGRMLQVAFIESEKPYNYKGRQAKQDLNGFYICVNVDSKDVIKIPVGSSLRTVKILYGNK